MVISSQAAVGTARDLKIVFTGPMGAGKTTAIRAISEGATLSTDVPMTGDERLLMPGKTMTTVGLDYGECAMDGQWTLKLFGTPGQERFRFMWDILGAGAFGLVVLADNTRPDPVGDVVQYLQACIDEAGDDAAFIAAALGDIARARGMTQLARDTGLGRESLYKALSGEGNPSFGTVLKVLAALGLRLTVEPQGTVGAVA